MTLQEFFDKYISKNPDPWKKWTEQTQLNSELKTALETASSSVPGISFMIYYIEKLNYSTVTPFECINFCNALNLVEITDFVNWSKALTPAHIGNIIKLLAPPEPTFGTFEKIKANDIVNIIKNDIPMDYKENNLHVGIPEDSIYQIPTLSDIQKVISYDKTNKLKYISQTRDCEDFAKLFKCAFRKLGIGNVTVFDCAINLYTPQGGLNGAHGINLLYYEDNGKQLRLFEPQSDSIRNFGDIFVGFKYYKIREITI